jgi:alpha-tubulin suppressor-like RCC1 family protein
MLIFGNHYSIILNEKNKLFVCGDNKFGQLGLGDEKERHLYIELKHNFGKIKNIYNGLEHNIILNETNEIFVCGYNFHGQLGLGIKFPVSKESLKKYDLGDDNFKNIYLKLSHNFGNIKKIICGDYHNIILNDNNELFMCGYNRLGQFGLGDDEPRYTYVKNNNTFGNIKNIFGGSHHSIILNEKNEIYVSGWNNYGQLGLGHNNNEYSFIKLRDNFGKIKDIFCGKNHNIILNEKNELYVCGYNFYGQLGLGDNNNRNKYEKLKHNFGNIVNIFCGFNNNFILNDKNEIFVCGINLFGQLGIGNNKNKYTYVKLDMNDKFGIIKYIYVNKFYNIIVNDKNDMFIAGYSRKENLDFGDNIYRYYHEKIKFEI